MRLSLRLSPVLGLRSLVGTLSVRSVLLGWMPLWGPPPSSLGIELSCSTTLVLARLLGLVLLPGPGSLGFRVARRSLWPGRAVGLTLLCALVLRVLTLWTPGLWLALSGRLSRLLFLLRPLLALVLGRWTATLLSPAALLTLSLAGRLSRWVAGL